MERFPERSSNPTGRFYTHGKRFPQRTIMVGQAGSKCRQTIRYHVIDRSDIPLEWGAAPEEVIFPEPIQSVFWKQKTKGEFLDTIFDCPFEMQELVGDSDIAKAICELKDVHKEVLYYSAIRQYSNQRIACIHNQTDRNILKVKNTILKKLRKKLYVSLCERQQMNLLLNQREKEFLEKYSSVFADKRQTKPQKSDMAKGKQTKNKVVIDDISLVCYDSNIFITNFDYNYVRC